MFQEPLSNQPFLGFKIAEEKQQIEQQTDMTGGAFCATWAKFEITRVIKSPYWEWNGIFNPYIVIDGHSHDGKYINGIIDLIDKWIGVRQLIL